MDSKLPYLIAADAILVIHFLFVGFVVLGLAMVFVGKLFSWSWVRNRRFRIAHLVAIGIVVLQSWFSVICPLTLWEMELRNRAGDVTYTGSFIAHWLETLLYYRAPEWVFILLYTLFGALVVGSWFWVRPRS
jgi:multisubunit Na+/H+ antiporter MnhB subunit